MTEQEMIKSYLEARGREAEVDEALKAFEATGEYKTDGLHVQAAEKPKPPPKPRAAPKAVEE